MLLWKFRVDDPFLMRCRGGGVGEILPRNGGYAAKFDRCKEAFFYGSIFSVLFFIFWNNYIRCHVCTHDRKYKRDISVKNDAKGIACSRPTSRRMVCRAGMVENLPAV